MTSYDNLGEATESRSYANATWDGEDGTISTSAGNLRAMSQSLYDELGRVYRSYTYEVDPADGTVGDRSAGNTWFNARGMATKSAGSNGLFSKTAFDGAGRAIAGYSGFDADESAYADADDVSGDTVIEGFRDVLCNLLSIGMLHGNVDSLRDAWHDSFMLRVPGIRQHGPVVGTATLAAEAADVEGRPRPRHGRPPGEGSGGVF